MADDSRTLGAFELPSYTLERIAKGEAILFLGSGASFLAKTASGDKALTATALRDALCNKFLGGKAKERTLAGVGDLVKSEAGILEMQRFLAETYSPLLPTAAHLELPKYRWKAIITTNYDLTIEKAYSQSTKPLQSLRPILSDDDQIGPVVANPERLVPLLKLHGCVTRSTDTQLPMILSSWEYSKFRNRRERLFNYLKEWGYEYPIIFCGYSISDENVRDILFELSDSGISHPRYALALPEIMQVDQRMWAERRIDAVPTTFDGLMQYLDREVPPTTRTLGYAFRGAAGPLSKFIPGNETPSPNLSAYMERQLILVHQGMPAEPSPAEDFFRGLSEGWSWLSNNLDVRRAVGDELELGVAIENEGQKVDAQLHVVLGYAGSGKSVALKRFCWELATTYSKPVFYLESDGTLDFSSLEELHSLLRDTIYLAVDDVIAHAPALAEALKSAKRVRMPLVVIGGARTNEWNVEGAELVPYVKQSYELLDLSDKEITGLVHTLRENKCLGYMKEFTDQEAIAFLKRKLENQLLVALHEATSGRSFSEIVADEYLNVVPTEAQKLYLDICTVHRVGVPVRAGTISRISGIRLEDFREKLFKPLEHVVQTRFNPSIGDYIYKSRHPKIAEIVFDSAVVDEANRSEQLVRIIGSMNTGYSSDNEAITRLIKSKDAARDFSDKELAYPIFRAAKAAGVSAEVVDQHLAHFEAIHKNGDLRKALSLIDAAIACARNGRPAKSTLHVKALILREIARDNSTSSVEKDKRRQEARAILDRLMADKRDPHPFNAKAALLLDELDERLDTDETQNDRVVSDLIREIQSALASARQLFPRDSFVAGVEARFATAMEQHPRATAILERAHRADPQTPFLSIRLAEKYRSEGRSDDAVAVLTRTLKAGGPNKEVHLAVAEVLIGQGQDKNRAAISDHLRRSFVDGDSRYRARFMFARHEYLYGNRDRGKAEFDLLGKERVPPGTINQTRDIVLDDEGQEKLFTGELLVGPRDTYCFARCVELASDVFIHRRDVPADKWTSLARGSRLNFSLGFSLRGPQALKVTVVS